jgi:hypothetical protein
MEVLEQQRHQELEEMRTLSGFDAREKMTTYARQDPGEEQLRESGSGSRPLS